MEIELLLNTICNQGLGVGLTIFLIWFFTKQWNIQQAEQNKTLELLKACLEISRGKQNENGNSKV